MKRFLLLILLVINIYADDFKNIKTFEADFKQKIINNTGKEIEYRGKIYIKHPSMLFWRYDNPIEKLVYIINRYVTIIEPELEQAVISKLQNEINILELLKKAKKINKNTFEAELQNRKYTLVLKDNILKEIKYTDEIDNNIVLSFFNTKQNHNIENGIFKYNIPYEYDVIKK